MNTKHTPGLVVRHYQESECTLSGFYHIGKPGLEEPPVAYVVNRSDAQLFAAAPLLVEALEAVLSDLRERAELKAGFLDKPVELEISDGILHKAKAALAAAKGEARGKDESRG